MSFAILRTAKLKSFGEIGGSLSHNYRDRPTPNANPQQTHNNEHSLSSADLVMTAIKNKLPEKRRKDAVLCVEYLITASPDWIGWNKLDEQKYFNDAKKWLENKHGKDNVIATTIHRDESTPHMIAYVVPLVDGKLKDVLTYYNYSGTPVNKAYKLFIPVEYGYKWKTLINVYEITVAPNSGTPGTR